MDSHSVIHFTLWTLRDALLPVVLDAYRHRFGRGAFAQVLEALKSDRYTPTYADMDAAQREIDPAGCLNLILRRWKEVFREKIDEECLSYVGELRQMRHDAAHTHLSHTDADLFRLVDTAIRLVAGFEALEVDLSAASNALAPLRADLLRRMSAQTPAARPAPAATAPPPPRLDAEMEMRIAALLPTWTRTHLRAEVVRLLHTLRPGRALPIPVLTAPRRPSWDDDRPRVVLLAPEHFHRSSGASPILRALQTWTGDGSAMLNSAFIAFDPDGAARLGDLTRRWLALVRLSMMETGLERADAELKYGLNAAAAAVEAGIAAAYHWLIVHDDDGWTAQPLQPGMTLDERTAAAAAWVQRRIQDR